ncbi:MAG TPA: hypothetical protein VK283_12665, partial [Acidimicrobiales bacterium]|nr:hypothetical protein [Acidimicrobiales bacterium]
GLAVSASGAVTTTGPLAAGPYTVSGTDLDADGDTGTWSFTLTVTAGIVVTVAPAPGPIGVIASPPTLTTATLANTTTRLPVSTRSTILPPTAAPRSTHRGPTAPVSTKSALGPQPTLPLLVSHATVEPGQSIVVTGSGCAPGTEVELFIAGQAVGMATVNGQGMFSASVTPPDQGAGQVTITAGCGSKRFATTVSLVATSAGTPPEGSVALFGIFVLLGAVLIRGQFGSATRRRRRKRVGASDILGMD